MTLSKLHFSPALPCIDCEQPTQQGLLSPTSSLDWQLLPICERESKAPADEEEAFSSIVDLQQLVARHLQVIHRLQRKRRHLARVYVRLRRQYTHTKAQRALRWKLNQTYRLLAEAMEVRR